MVLLLLSQGVNHLLQDCFLQIIAQVEDGLIYLNIVKEGEINVVSEPYIMVLQGQKFIDICKFCDNASCIQSTVH